MLHVLRTESISRQAAKDDHADERGNLNLRHARFEVDRANLTTLEVNTLHENLDQDASDRSHERHDEQGLNLLTDRTSHWCTSTSSHLAISTFIYVV